MLAAKGNGLCLMDLPAELILLILKYLRPSEIALVAAFNDSAEKRLNRISILDIYFTNRYFINRISRELLKIDLSQVLVSFIKDIDDLCIFYSSRHLPNQDTSWFLVFEKLYGQLIAQNSAKLFPCHVCKLDFKKRLAEYVNSGQTKSFQWQPHCNFQHCVFFSSTGSFGNKIGNAYDYGWF
jgi:hypothetical protein